jgi:hypothetical protein
MQRERERERERESRDSTERQQRDNRETTETGNCRDDWPTRERSDRESVLCVEGSECRAVKALIHLTLSHHSPCHFPSAFCTYTTAHGVELC